MMYKQVSEELLSLIQQSPSCFHAVRTISALLEEAGYTQLNECDSWKLEKGGKYYTTRNGSSVIAFAIGEELDDYHFQLTSSHSDSPTFKVKERAELKGKGGATKNVMRTQKDISMKVLTFALIAALVVTFVFFYFGVIHNLFQTIVAFIVVTVIAFLFTTVAANAIAIVGTNPVSGMTLMTLIIASAIFVAIGLNGASGIVASMIIGGVVCTALSMAGGMVTDMKIGYWLGSTPQKQQSWKLVGTFVSAATVGGVILILAKVYGFSGPDALAAPQANAMAAVIEPLMMGGNTPWMLYGVGAILAVLLNWLGVPALAFSLGMFIPLELNAPLLVGGLISWFVSNRSKDKELNSARQERGTLLASGFIAGGALMGVVSAGMRFAGFEYSHSIDETTLQITGVVMYLLLIGYLTWDSLRAKKQG